MRERVPLNVGEIRGAVEAAENKRESRQEAVAQLKGQAFRILFDYGETRKTRTGVSSGKRDVIGLHIESVDFVRTSVCPCLDAGGNPVDLYLEQPPSCRGGVSEEIVLYALNEDVRERMFVIQGGDCQNALGEPATREEIETFGKTLAVMAQVYSESASGERTEPEWEEIFGS